MSLPVIDPDRIHIDAIAISRARRFWAPAGGSPYALPASKSASRRHSSDAAVSDPPPSLDLVLHARKLLRGQRVPLARPAAVTGRIYHITDRDVENLDRAMRDLSDLIAPLRTPAGDIHAQACMVVARLDRVIGRVLASECQEEERTA
jgi:hypothetical protein